MTPQEYFKEFQKSVRKDWDQKYTDLEGRVISHYIDLLKELDGYTAQDLNYAGFPEHKKVLTRRYYSYHLMKIGCILGRAIVTDTNPDQFLRNTHSELVQHAGLLQEIAYPE